MLKKTITKFTIKELKKELLGLRSSYQMIVDRVKEHGLNTLNGVEMEEYGTYLGKIELCEHLIKKLD